MSTEVIVAIIVLAGGGLTVYGNYLISKRQTSGNITTSAAADLWEESNNLRNEYKERAEKLEAQLEEVNSKLRTVMSQLTVLKGKGDKMIKKIDELKRTIAKLRKENSRLLAEKKKVDGNDIR